MDCSFAACRIALDTIQVRLALTAEGRVVQWPDSSDTPVPLGLSNVVAIAAGGSHSLALTAEGRVVAWGYNVDGQTDVPSGLTNVVAIAAGQNHSLTLSGLPPGRATPASLGPRFLVGTADRPFHHRIVVKNGADRYGAAGMPSGLVLDPNTGLVTGTPTQAGSYPLVFSATNEVGSTVWKVTLFVNEPAAPGINSPGIVHVGVGSSFSFPVVAYNAPEWYGASGLPSGWRINAQTGLISAIPLEVGDFVVSLVASNRYGLGTGSLTIRVSPVVAWGGNWAGQTSVPLGLNNVVAIAAGSVYSLALTTEGRVLQWPEPPDYSVPRGLSNVVAIAGRASQPSAES